MPGKSYLSSLNCSGDNVSSIFSKTVIQLSGFSVAANVDDFSQQPVLPKPPQVGKFKCLPVQ